LLDAIAHLLQLELHDDGHYSYKGGVDREAKLNEWERFYNFHRQTHAFANLIVPYLSPRTNIKIELKSQAMTLWTNAILDEYERQKGDS
jgi:hypothetical protein